MSKRSTAPRAVDPAHVAVRAYFAWQNGGCRHGHDVADWLAAEAAQRRSDAARQGAATRAAAIREAGRAAMFGADYIGHAADIAARDVRAGGWH